MSSGFGVRDDQRVALFIDGPSFFQTTRALGFEVNYKSLLEHFDQSCNLYRAFYFTAISESEEFSPIRPLVDWLGYNGYTLVTKSLKNFVDREGRRKMKGSVHVEMAVEMLEAAQFCDHMIVFTGDGDMCAAVDAVKRKGVRVTVVSTRGDDVSALSDELRRTADRFVDLKDVKPLMFKADVVVRDYSNNPQNTGEATVLGPVVERRPLNIGVARRA